WCFASPGDRAWWASTWADRMTASSLADQVVDRQLGTREDLATVAQGFGEWAARDDGWFAVLHGEVLCRG
ncbi:MAG TPA: SAM-dependent methyltransferase, partial [Mycobacteriales bacterium]|nr:SAM-dependent methyltransferase [Mycobacteriales bacterium]